MIYLHEPALEADEGGLAKFYDGLEIAGADAIEQYGTRRLRPALNVPQRYAPRPGRSRRARRAARVWPAPPYLSLSGRRNCCGEARAFETPCRPTVAPGR